MTVSSTTGAGKTGQLHAKKNKDNGLIFYTIYKNELKLG